MQKGLELLVPRRPGQRFRHAVLDFDGTLSLVREGWQNIMIPYFTAELQATPQGRDTAPDLLADEAREFVFLNTGKQTIYQCIELARHIQALGGSPQDPQHYKDEYQRRLLEAIDRRLKGLEHGDLDPEPLTVPGSRPLLELLCRRGLTLYLASGTDEHYVVNEARLLGLDGFFQGRVYGAQRDYKTFSKRLVIERILRENAIGGEALVGFGDGYVEIENVKAVGGYACGVASNERTRQGIDPWKRERVIRAGADLVVPDYRDLEALEAHLFD